MSCGGWSRMATVFVQRALRELNDPLGWFAEQARNDNALLQIFKKSIAPMLCCVHRNYISNISAHATFL